MLSTVSVGLYAQPMSMPSIPGYLEPPKRDTLADLWLKPAGDYPDELWLVDDLHTVTNSPSGWLIVEEHFFTEAKHGGRGCVLVDAAQPTAALKATMWIGRGLGNIWIWDDERFDNGLETIERDVAVEFFVHARKPSGASLPVIEISHPFLWYWDAFPINTGWRYLDRAGREQELIRWERSDDSWKVEVRALEFRQFLAACGRHAIVQLDLVPNTDSSKFDRVDDEFENEWAHVDFYVLHDLSMGDRPAFSRLLGQYLITGLRNSRVPRFEERAQDHDYPTFIYALDSETGQPLRIRAIPINSAHTSTRTAPDFTTSRPFTSSGRCYSPMPQSQLGINCLPLSCPAWTCGESAFPLITPALFRST